MSGCGAHLWVKYVLEDRGCDVSLSVLWVSLFTAGELDQMDVVVPSNSNDSIILVFYIRVSH